MENKDLPDIGKILESIKNNLKAELDIVKADLKSDLKMELDSIKSDIKTEIDSLRAAGFPFRETPPHPTHIPPEDFAEPEVSDRESQKKTEEFPLKDFTGIHVGGAFEVEIVRSDSYGVSITAEESLFRNLDISKDGDILRIGHSRHIGWRAQITRPKARIKMPMLKELRMYGASKAALSGFDSDEALQIRLTGACSVGGDITSGDAEFEMSGASRARLTGSAKDVIIKTSGASHMELGEYAVHNAAVRLSGASRITVKMDGRLDARLSGVSHFSWIGNPVMGDIRTSGASKLSRE